MDVWTEDWKYAQLRTKETSRPEPHLKRFIGLVPGDRYVHLGDEFEVLWWPQPNGYGWKLYVQNAGLSHVWVPINPGQDVAAWKGRDVNYGTGRCGHCLCFVQRSHVPGSEDCLLAGQERRQSQSDWEVLR